MTRVIIATEIGDIEADLFTDGAPKTSQNFVDLANKGFYDDVIFHRVIPGFVIQGVHEQHTQRSSKKLRPIAFANQDQKPEG